MSINQAISYALSVVGSRYLWWHPGMPMIGDHGPFWAYHAPAPEADVVKSSATTCTGLINLMRRSIGLSVPGVAEDSPYAGGTYEWFNYLEKKGRLQPLDETKHYPKGTLLLSPWVDQANQGHVAVILSTETVDFHELLLLHSYSQELYNAENRSFVSPGVCIESARASHSWKSDGYYTHVCLPADWLEAE